MPTRAAEAQQQPGGALGQAGGDAAADQELRQRARGRRAEADAHGQHDQRRAAPAGDATRLPGGDRFLEQHLRHDVAVLVGAGRGVLDRLDEPDSDGVDRIVGAARGPSATTRSAATAANAAPAT